MEEDGSVGYDWIGVLEPNQSLERKFIFGEVWREEGLVSLGEKWVFLEREVMREGEKRDGRGEVVVVLMMIILFLVDLSSRM